MKSGKFSKASPQADDYMDFFYSMGMPMLLRGTRYLATAASISSEEQLIHGGVTKEVYPAVAKIHNTSAQSVERCMRWAIASFWENEENRDLIPDFFLNSTKSLTGRKPTNSEFLMIVKKRIPKE